MPLSVYAEREKGESHKESETSEEKDRERVRSGVEEAKRVRRKSALAKRKLCGT